MPARNELVVRASALGFDASTIPNDSKLEQKVLWLEKNATAFTGALATGTLTSDTTNVTEDDTVTIGDVVYTFKDTLSDPEVANEVLIGASAAATLDNLKAAINNTGTAGTDYSSNTPIHPTVTATTNTDTTQVVEAKTYAYTNGSVATTEASSHLSWGAATLASGTPKVVAPASTTTGGAPGLSGDKNV